MVIKLSSNFLQSLINYLSGEHALLFTVVSYTILISLYVVFVWKFYKFIAERDIIKLNLKQYNRSEHPQLGKFYEILLSTLEYIIILPFLVIFWFVVFSLFFLILSENQDAQKILLLTAAIIASTRVVSYISQSLAREMVKVFPFTILFLFLLNPSFFNINLFFGKIIQIPAILDSIKLFIIFIFTIEFILRIFYSIVLLIYSED